MKVLSGCCNTALLLEKMSHDVLCLGCGCFLGRVVPSGDLGVYCITETQIRMHQDGAVLYLRRKPGVHFYAFRPRKSTVLERVTALVSMVPGELGEYT